jgi:hypothetical protein
MFLPFHSSRKSRLIRLKCSGLAKMPTIVVSPKRRNEWRITTTGQHVFIKGYVGKHVFFLLCFPSRFRSSWWPVAARVIVSIQFGQITTARFPYYPQWQHYYYYVSHQFVGRCWWRNRIWSFPNIGVFFFSHILCGFFL